MPINTDKNKIQDILERGVEEIVDKTHLKKQLLSGKKLRIKLGIDPTGPKLHIGRAIVLWKLRAFQELGHQIVLIIGDFTALIGDASDKQEKRKQLSEKEIRNNMKNYEKQLGKILDMKKVELRHNSEWLGKMTWGQGLKLSQNFTAQQLIQRRNFKERWNKAKPIGLHELSYPLLQGLDSVAIKADVEIGGFDQLFNLQAGRDIQKINNQSPQDIMTLKMLNGLDGRKMSTSWGNSINILDKPNDMFGKIMSMKDEYIGEYFELCSNLSLNEIKNIKTELKNKTANPRDIKARLARTIVKMYYDEKTAIKAENEFNKIFRDKKRPSKLPRFKAKNKIYDILDLLYETGLAKSKSEARRLIANNGVKINDKIKSDWKEKIIIENNMVIQVGKLKFIKIIK